MRQQSLATLGTTLAILTIFSGCSAREIAPASSIVFDESPRALDEIECDSLLANDEIETILSGPVTSHGKRASSCYWFAGDDLVQLVIQSGRDISTWKSLILDDYTPSRSRAQVSRCGRIQTVSRLLLSAPIAGY